MSLAILSELLFSSLIASPDLKLPKRVFTISVFVVVNVPVDEPSTTPYAPLSRPYTYCPGVKLPTVVIRSSRRILVKNCGSKYDRPNVVL